MNRAKSPVSDSKVSAECVNRCKADIAPAPVHARLVRDGESEDNVARASRTARGATRSPCCDSYRPRCSPNGWRLSSITSPAYQPGAAGTGDGVLRPAGRGFGSASCARAPRRPHPSGRPLCRGRCRRHLRLGPRRRQRVLGAPRGHRRSSSSLQPVGASKPWPADTRQGSRNVFSDSTGPFVRPRKASTPSFSDTDSPQSPPRLPTMWVAAR